MTSPGLTSKPEPSRPRLSFARLRTIAGSSSKTPPILPSFTASSPISSFDFSLPSTVLPILKAIPWTYTERQQSVKDIIAAAPDGSTVIIGYGGAVGGGKTFLEAGDAADTLLDEPGAEILVGRQDFVDLKDTTLKQFDKMTLGLPFRRKYDSAPVYRELKRRDDLPWSRATFRGLEDWESLMSAEYRRIYIEEAHEVPLEAVLGLLSRLRQPGARVYVMLICFNPLGGWPEKWFMKGELPAEVKELPELQIHFVPARMSDNPHLRPGYEAMLRAMYPEHLVQRLINGLPGGVENAVYPHFNRELHIVDLPRDVRFRDGAFGADYGRVHKSASVAVSVDQYGRRWVREAWGRPSDDHGDELVRVVGKQRNVYKLTRGRVDPNQDVLAGRVQAHVAKSGEGSRQHRINLTGALLNTFPGGRVPDQAQDLYQAWPHGPYVELDSPGLLFVRGAPGIDDLVSEIESYHYEHKVSTTRDEMVVARVNDDLVAALEYAIEELAEGPDYTGLLTGRAALRGRA